MSRSRVSLGRYGEDRAVDYLLSMGMEILDRNWRCAAGEIDIVARDGEDLVVVEVKTRRSNDFGLPQEAVGQVKLRRLWKLGILWREHSGIVGRSLRIDVVAIVQPIAGQREILHLRGVS